MSKKVAILQSNYIPWKGYFDLISYVDEFIIYDEVQYTKNDWRNRNQIKTPTGLQWLTIPVNTKHCSKQKVSDASIANNGWQIKHWNSLIANYSKSLWFNEISSRFKPLYIESYFSKISEVNRVFIEFICSFLQINTKISCSSNFTLIGEKSERLASICEQTGATEYVSGPAAKTYIDQDVFLQKKINLKWFNYDSYPEYPQLWGDFRHEVSILDLLFNCGENACNSMKYITTANQ